MQISRQIYAKTTWKCVPSFPGKKIWRPQPVPQQAACPQACPTFPFVWVLNLGWASCLATQRSGVLGLPAA